MKNSYMKFSLTVIAASLMSAYGTARAADDELAELTKPSSSVSVGAGSWDHDRQQLGAYDGMSKNQPHLLLDADIQKRDDESGTWTTLKARNLGLETRDLQAEFLKQGDWGVGIEFDQLESLAPYTINTNHLGIGSINQTLGTNIPNTAIGSGANYQFGTKREKFGINGYKNLMENVDLRIKFSTETKDGERITSNGSALFVADLIDYTTDKLDASLDYTGEKLQLSGGYSGSWFTNKNDSGLVVLGGTTRMTQPLDNQAHQLFLNGGYNFAPSTRGNFKLAFTQGTQDETPPTSRISSTAFALIPELDGKVDTTLVQAGLSSRPMPRLSVVASLRYYDVKDKTPARLTLPNTTGAGAAVLVNTTPYSYKTSSGKVEGTYDLSQGYSLTAGIDLSEQDRTMHNTNYVPLRAQLDETTYRLQLRKSLSETMNGSIAYSMAERDGSDYAVTGAVTAATSIVSPVNSADRDRQKIRLALDWTPIESVGVQLAVESAEDEYGTSARPHGLHEGNANLYSLDVSYQLNEDWQIAGWYSQNTNDSHFINRNSATNNNIKEQKDTGDAIGLNLRGKINSKTKIGAEISWSDDKTEFDQRNSDGSTLVAVAPSISSKVTQVKLFADYAIQKNTDVRVNVAHERWNTNDWQWNFQDGRPFQYGTATDGTTVIRTTAQDATFVGVRFVQRFQ